MTFLTGSKKLFLNQALIDYEYIFPQRNQSTPSTWEPRRSCGRARASHARRAGQVRAWGCSHQQPTLAWKNGVTWRITTGQLPWFQVTALHAAPGNYSRPVQVPKPAASISHGLQMVLGSCLGGLSRVRSVLHLERINTLDTLKWRTGHWPGLPRWEKQHKKWVVRACLPRSLGISHLISLLQDTDLFYRPQTPQS